MKAVETLLIPLACGDVARLEITVEEEPLPSPLELGTLRAPTIRELDEIAAVLARRGWKFPAKPGDTRLEDARRKTGTMNPPVAGYSA